MTLPKQRQQHADPPAALETQSPSMVIYVVLLLIATLLVVVSLAIDDDKWSGLLSNMATEIFGSVLILIIVDHRIRQSDVRLIRGLTGRLNSALWSVFSQDAAVVRYCQVLDAALNKVRPQTYFHRKSLDSLEKRNPAGFVLLGDAGLGKTTLLQHIATRLSRSAIAEPRTARVPVLIPGRDLLPKRWSESISAHMNAYSWMSSNRVESLMKAGRVSVLLDGLDESPDRETLLAELRAFREEYPGNQIIMSARPYLECALEGLPTIAIQPLTPAEVEQFHKL